MPTRSMPPQYLRRVRSLRRRFDAAGIDALLVSYSPDQYYLTGAVLEDSAVLVTARDVLVVTDSRFDEQVSQQSPWASKVLRRDGLAEAVNSVVADLGSIRSLGVQGEFMPVGEFRNLARKLARGRVKPTRGLASAGRIVKDAGELAIIERAIRAAEAGFRAVLKIVKPGLRERELAAELEYQMRLAGAAGAAFEPIVAAGPRGSLPHARAGETRLQPGQPVLFDWGAKVAGYCSDLTRVILVGAPQATGPGAGLKARGHVAKTIAQIFPIVLEAQLAGIAAIRPGARGRDVDRVARQVIERAGFGPRFGHGLGHGIGLDIHEAPRLSARSKDVLRPGMVVTVEPGIYLPGVGGVRIEDDVLVTKTGHRVLTHLPKSLEF